ncbi:hypothetical protein QBC34DRAFT_106803 [Podospora aff. communis PSN243]|uniref:EKC/KEOPS complex subunit GON7 n=1 Tax=Podospora aff. communis PSN243 TaxID=3040156 RepID=A0AAV9H693_9PEZI|nr:hypothetical protein QBC34DRAFT_106803 [Podospora aff. communis PSN243]
MSSESNTNAQPTYTLSATYPSTSGNDPFNITLPLDGPSTALPAVQAKSDYLKRLRTSILTVQDQVNKELTIRMEQDNAKSAAPVDSKDEENYGEEVQEEED